MVYESTAERILPAWLWAEGLRSCMPVHGCAFGQDWLVVSLSDDPCTPCSCPVKPVDRAELYREPGTGFAHHRCGYDHGCRWGSHRGRNTTDGFTSTYAGPGFGITEHRHGACNDSAASSGVA